MSRDFVSALAFTAVVVAASVAAVLVSRNALADEIATGSDAGIPAATAGATRSRLGPLTVDDLKHDYLMCERAVTQAGLDLATLAACSALYEELYGRVFGGDLEAFTAWLRGAWSENADLE
jgi:hypothetical protein